jgi:hypothetical protein
VEHAIRKKTGEYGQKNWNTFWLANRKKGLIPAEGIILSVSRYKPKMTTYNKYGKKVKLSL